MRVEKLTPRGIIERIAIGILEKFSIKVYFLYNELGYYDYLVEFGENDSIDCDIYALGDIAIGKFLEAKGDF